MGQVKCDRWQVTHDTWHMKHDEWGGVNIHAKFQLSSSIRLEVMMFSRSGGKGSLSEIN